jgi:hypothetical protein
MLKDSGNKPEFTESELTAFEGIEFKEIDTKKSQSKRLRDVLYLLWEKEGKNGTSEDYYETKMNVLIEHFKQKLD